MLLLVFTGTAAAEKITKTVRSGYNSAIYSLAIYDKLSCRGGIVPRLVRSKAEHGKISMKRIKRRIPKGKRCSGNTYYYAVVYYQPNRGFRGKDKARFSLSFPKYVDGSGRSLRYIDADLTVR